MGYADVYKIYNKFFTIPLTLIPMCYKKASLKETNILVLKFKFKFKRFTRTGYSVLASLCK